MAAAPSFVRLENRQECSIDWSSPSNARFDFVQRLANAFLANEWRSDMSFYVPRDDRSFPGHSLIVGAASPMLERCCFKSSDGVLNADTIITLPDYCSAETMQIVLRYLYTGATCNELNENNVAAVLKIADFFDLHELMNHCGNILAVQLTADNVCAIFEQTHHVEIAFNEKCIQFMKENLRDILQNGSAMQMSDNALGKLLAVDELDIADESDLAVPMIKWADVECESRGIVVSPENRRLVLNKRTQFIRFASMKMESFMECVRLFGANFFRHDEISLTVQQIYSQSQSETPAVNISPFSSIVRTPTTLYDYEYLLGTQNLDVTELREDSFIVDVSHLKKPFIVTGVRFFSRPSNTMIVKNAFTNELLSNIDHDHIKIFRFNKGVEPNREGKIHLIFTHQLHELFWLYTFLPSLGDGPKIVNEKTCVAALFYQSHKQ